MHKLESVLENKTYTILWDFEIQTDRRILARRLVRALISQKEMTSYIKDFAVTADTERKWKKAKR